MIPIVNEVVLAVSSSLAASVVAKATVTTALGLIGTWLARRSRAAVRHTLLAVAFGMLLVLPIASIVAPPVHIAVQSPAQDHIAPVFARASHAIPPVGPTHPSVGGASVGPQSVGLSASALLLWGWIGGAVTLSAARGDGAVASSFVAAIWSAVAAWASLVERIGARCRHPSACRSAAARLAARTDDLRRRASCHRAASGRRDLGRGRPESRHRT